MHSSWQLAGYRSFRLSSFTLYSQIFSTIHFHPNTYWAKMPSSYIMAADPPLHEFEVSCFIQDIYIDELFIFGLWYHSLRVRAMFVVGVVGCNKTEVLRLGVSLLQLCVTRPIKIRCLHGPGNKLWYKMIFRYKPEWN